MALILGLIASVITTINTGFIEGRLGLGLALVTFTLGMLLVRLSKATGERGAGPFHFLSSLSFTIFWTAVFSLFYSLIAWCFGYAG